MRICLFRPDMPGNFGTIIRSLACFGFDFIDVILPTGFILDSKEVKRSMLDYGQNFEINKYKNFEAYQANFPNNRIVLATTKSSVNYTDFPFNNNDILLFGSESGGVTDEVHNKVQNRVCIPMKNNMRSLNLAVSVGIITSEAMRQGGG